MLRRDLPRGQAGIKMNENLRRMQTLLFAPFQIHVLIETAMNKFCMYGQFSAT